MPRAICLAVSTAPLFPRPLEEMFRILRQQPLREVELMPQSPAECRPEFAAELIRCSGEDFHICSIHFPLILHAFLYNPYPSAREYGRWLCEGLAALAGRLQSRVLVVHAPSKRMGQDPFLEVAVENTRYLCDLCAPHGVQVCLENSASAIAETPEQMQAWAKRIARPNFAYTLDTTHAHQSKLDPVAFVEALPRLEHLHVSDYDLQRGPHQPVGRGQVAWSRLGEALRRRGFSGSIVLELSTETVGQDPAATLRESVVRLQDWLSPLLGGIG